jgi:hypothetical protein
VEEAEQELALFLAAKAKVPESRRHLIYNTYADVLGVAESMLQVREKRLLLLLLLLLFSLQLSSMFIPGLSWQIIVSMRPAKTQNPPVVLSFSIHLFLIYLFDPFIFPG